MLQLSIRTPSSNSAAWGLCKEMVIITLRLVPLPFALALSCWCKNTFFSAILHAGFRVFPTNQHRNLLQVASEISAWCVTGITTTHSTPQYWLMCNCYQVSEQHIQVYKSRENHVKSIVPSLKTSSIQIHVADGAIAPDLPPLLARSRHPWRRRERLHR